MHVTVIFLGDDVPMQQLASAMVACHAVTSKTAPFTLTVSDISSFEPGGNGTPVIMPVQSPELMTLEQELKAEFDRAGIPYSTKWPEFKPHVTLSYVPGMKASGPLPVPVSWGAFDLTIYGANHGDGMSVVLPFELPNIEVKMQKIAAKIAAML
jgi:2'-5' RNA ligase